MKKQKAIFMLFVMLMSVMTQFGSSILTIQAFAAETGRDITGLPSADQLPVDKNNKRTIMTLEKMEVKNSDGSTETVNDARPLNVGETFFIYYTFRLPNDLAHEVQDGDYFKYQLPTSEFLSLTEDQSGDLKDPDNGELYGRFEANTDGEVTLIFNDNVHRHDDVDGRIYFSMSVENKKITIPGGYPITIPDVTNTEDTIIWIAGDNKSYIQKEFVELKGDVPTWKVLINPNSLKMNDLRLKDETTHKPEENTNGTNAAENIKITKLVEATVYMDGRIEEGREVSVNNPVADKDGLLDIGMTSIDKPYVIYLETPLVYGVKGEVTNHIFLNANLGTSGKNVGEAASASFVRDNKYNVIEKEAGEFDADNQEIEWKIIYNPNGLHIKQEDAKFTDTLTYGTVIEDSITVEPNLRHTVTTKNDGRAFDFQFDEDVNQRVVITYKSKRTDLAASYAKNTVISGGQKVVVQKDTPTDGGGEGPGPGPGPGDEKSSVSKTHKKTGDYMVNWTVDVNKEKIALDKWQIEDMLTNGEFKEDTLVVTNKTTGEIVPPSEYEVQWLGLHPDIPNTNHFLLIYDHPTSDHFSISYDSTVGRGTADNFAYYNYWHKDTEYKDQALDYIHTTSSEIKLTKSGKLIPKDNEIEWVVTVNGDGKTPMADQNLLRDPIPSGQTYVEGSAEVYSGTGQLLRPDSKAKVDYDSHTNELRITNMEAYSGEQLIFRTSLDDPLAPYRSEPISNTVYYSDRYQKEEIKASASLSIGNVNESFLKKSGTNVDGKYVDWRVDINEHGYHLSNVTIYDDSWENQRVLRESIAIKDLFGNKLLEGIDYDLDHTERYFTIKMKNDVTQHLILTYRGEIFFPSNSHPLDNVPIKNSVRITADRIITTGKPIEIQVPVQVPGSGGEIIGKTRDLVIEKVSASNANTKLRDAEFTLYRGDKKDINKVVDHGTTDGDGRARFTKLTSGTYLLVETKAPSGYEISNELKEGKVINVSGDSTNEFVQVIENPEEGTPPVDPETFIDIPVEKRWKEVPSGRPTPNVTVRLFANDVEKDAMILRESSNYKGIFTNLPEKQGGKEIKYEIKEDKVAGYTTSTSGNNNGWVVTNTYIAPDTVNVPVQKIWANAPGATPPVTVVLYANDRREDSAELNTSNGYKYTFTNLDKEDEKGNEITYTIKEVQIPDYTSKLIENIDGWLIINTYIEPSVEMIDIRGQKHWEDKNDSKRPDSVTIVLKQDGNEYNTTNARGPRWDYTFSQLPKDDGKGHEYTYTVEEKNVPTGYEVSKGPGEYDLTNTYKEAELISKSGKKTWRGDSSSNRPSSIEVQLLRDGEPFKTTTARADNWEYSFDNLPKDDGEGHTYEYTVKEKNVPEGYTSEVNGMNIINTYSKVTVSGEKRWVGDEDDKDQRPSSITVNLLANGNEIKSTTTNASKNWKYEFADLDAKDSDGKDITYTVKEVKVPGYETMVSGYDIVNTFDSSDKVTIVVKKEWANDEAIKGTSRYRPSVSVDLNRNGRNIAVAYLNEDNQWQQVFTDLDKFDENGEEYEYSINEFYKPNGYTPTYSKDGKTFIVTNTYKDIPKTKINIAGEKHWEDNDDSKRPREVTIDLYCNGYQIESTKARAPYWEYEFKDLPEYDEVGDKNSYGVKEANVPEGYESNGGPGQYDITNKLKGPELISKLGKKTWSGDTAADRPGSIEVKLLQDDKEIKTTTTNANKNWEYSFDGLPKDDGKGHTYEYTVKEGSVPSGYKSEVNGMDIKNTYNKTNVSGKKIWEDDNNEAGKRPESVKIQLLQDGTPFKTTTAKAPSWTYSFDDLPKDDGKGHTYKYTVEEADVPSAYTSEVNGMNIINTYTEMALVRHEVEKKWNETNGSNRPESIEIQLYRYVGDDEEKAEKYLDSVEMVPNHKGNWTYTFWNLPKYKEGTKEEYNYYADEVNIPEGYKRKLITSSGGDNETTIENVYFKTIDIKGQKRWEDYGYEDSRPNQVTVQLQSKPYFMSDNYFEDVPGKRVTTTADKDWKYEFNDLPDTSEYGYEINYRVVAVDEDSIYFQRSEDYDVVNYFNPDKVNIKGEKFWNDLTIEGKPVVPRPEFIEVQLQRTTDSRITENTKWENVPGERQKVTGPEWKYQFLNQPRQYDYFTSYTYRVVEAAYNYEWENPLKNYSPAYDGKNNIINTYAEKTAVFYEKEWDDEGHEDIRPERINIHLLQDGKRDVKNDGEISQYTHNLKTSIGRGGFGGLDKYDPDDLREYVYTVEEELLPDKDGNVPDYYDAVSTYKEEVNRTYIKNTYNPKISISGEKEWVDNDNSFKRRPSSVKIYLLRDGQRVKDANNEDIYTVADESTDWKYRFTDLSKINKETKEDYVYTVEEELPKDLVGSDSQPGYVPEYSGYDIRNVFQNTAKVDVSGTKTWDHGTNEASKRPDAVIVQLLQDGSPMTGKTQTVTAKENWTYEFKELPKFDDFSHEYQYTVKEIGITVNGKDVSGDYNTVVTGTDIHNTFNKPVKTAISGEKIWDDYDNKFKTRPSSIKVELMKKDNKTNQVVSTGQTQKVTKDLRGHWKYSFTNLDKFDTDGKVVEYSVKEVESTALNQYETTINGNNIYNTYVNTDKVKVDVTKKWFDYKQNELSEAPVGKIKVTLLQNSKTDFEYSGKKVVELNQKNNWQHTFTDLPRYDNNGDKYEYTVIEEGITDYETDYELAVDKTTGDTTVVISNTEPKPDMTIISGIKIWDDHNDVAKLRPETVEIEVLRNGQSFSEEAGQTKTTTTTSAKDNWEYSFQDLLLNDEKGEKYSYTVVEHLPKDSVYESKVEGTNITNKYHRSAQANVTVKKEWHHDHNDVTKRPKDIVVQLLRDEVVLEEVTLNEANDYQHTFEKLEVYDGVGVEYRYDVVEKVPEGYDNERQLESDGKNNYIVTLTNTFVEKELTAINGEKIWDDYDNDHNTRPSAVTIQLFANETFLKQETIHGDVLNPDAPWTYNFDDLDKFDKDGKEIDYTVKEVIFVDPKEVLPGQQAEYVAEIIGNESIVNTYRNNKTVNFSGKKTWKYDQNVLDKRPEALNMMLVRDGRYVVDMTTTNKESDWEYEFTNKGAGYPVYRPDGSLFVYTLREEAIDQKGNVILGIENYRPSMEVIGDISKDNNVEINVTNTYEHTEKTQFSGSKTWEDADNKFGKRPTELKVTLYANEKAIKTETMNEANEWKYEFSELPVYDKEGEKITYRIEEETTPGYEQIQGAPNFFNRLKQLDEKTAISGQKIWKDQDNSLNKRPDSVTIELYRNGIPMIDVVTGEVVKQEIKGDDWTYEFKDLAKYDSKGNEYIYTVEEVPVANYESTVDGTTITNTYINNDKTSVSGQKIWKGDQANKVNSRPKAITVELYQLKPGQKEIEKDQQPFKTQSVTPGKEENWFYTFDNLPKYNEDLKEYTYVIKEEDVPHYDSSVENAPDYTITNTYKNDEVTDFRGKKTWVDKGNKLKTRPESITINLYQLVKGQTDITEGQEVFATQEVKPDKDGNWTYEFDNLPKYDEKLDAYSYIAKEKAVPNYETTSSDGGHRITNTYQNTDKTTVTGEKTWKGDFDNKIKTRPTSIEVNLYQNGGKEPYQTQTVKPDKKGNWTYEFKDLPKYDETLDAYTYTVTETKVPGYTTEYDEKESVVNLTNTYINDQKVEVPVVKNWHGDLNNHLNTRPGSIIIELYQNDVLMSEGTKEIKPDKEGNWSYTYKELPKYDKELNEYVYTVKEKEVADYTTTIEQPIKNEFVINNSFDGATTMDITGRKSWVDVDEANRPESIKVQLQRTTDKELTTSTKWQNVGKVTEVTPDKDGNWEYSFVGQDIVDDAGNYYQYRVVEIGDDGQVNTSITGKNETVYQPTTTDWDIVNTQQQRKISIPVIKKWDEPNNNLRPESITLTLFRDGVAFKKEVLTGDKASATWNYTFTELDEFNPDTMVKYVYTVKEDAVPYYDTTITEDGSNGFTITNKANPRTEVEVDGEKTWADSDNGFNKRPESITVHLLQDGQKFKQQLVTAPDWTYAFTGLPEYNQKTLTKYVYTVKEELSEDIIATDEQSGYKPTYSGHDINNEFQNTDTISVAGEKTWHHGTNALEERPTSVTIQLLQNGNPMSIDGKLVQAVATEDTDWRYEFKELPKFDETGKEYLYTAEEISVPNGYESVTDGMNVTNTFTKPVKTSVSGEKTWVDYNNKFKLRPESITVNLMKEVKDAEGKVVKEQVASQEVTGDEWKYEFNDLFKYDEAGLEIKYSIEEDKVPEYETTIEGNNITNTYTNKETTKISVLKVWDDTDNKDKERPKEIQVQLLMNGDYDLDDDGVVDQSEMLNDKNKWSHTFDELPKYDNNGEEIDYMVVEEGISGYLTTYQVNPETGTTEKQIVITNKKAKYQETAISGLKIWDDYGNAHGSRPEDITIKLLQDGKPMLDENGKEVTTTINESNGVDGNTWSYAFDGLPKNRDDGTQYVYTVEEVHVDHYKTTQKKNSTNITNTYRNEEKLQVKVKKTWDHSKNQLDARPENITVYLKQDGRTIDTKVLNSSNEWQHAFENLPKYDESGVLYQYDVVEDVPNGYENKRELIQAGNSYTVQMTNTFTEDETTEIKGTKVWDDYDNKFNTRPSSVTIQLFADGVYQESQVISVDTLNTDEDWTYHFTNLDKYTTEGTLIEYTVQEVMMTNLIKPLGVINAEYTPEIVDNDYIINHYTNHQKVMFSGTKTWKFDQNVLENRPTALKISLVRDGRLVVDTAITSEADAWQYAFTNKGEGYPVYRPDGNPYHYTVREEALDENGEATLAIENYHTKVEVVGDTEEDEEVELNLTNFYNHTETTELTGSKEWQDVNNKLGDRPDALVVTLFANDEVAKTATMTEATGWTYEFTSLPVYDAKGDKITYRVEEEKVDGYEEIQGAPYFVNYLTKLDDKTSIKGTKTWDDQNDKLGGRPNEVTVVLLRDGVPVIEDNQVVTTKVSAKTDWTYEFKDLPKYDGQANEYVYSVKEINVPNYITSVDGTNLVNTYHSSEVVAVKGTKSWVDQDDKLGDRPKEIFVELYQTTKDHPEVAEDQAPYRMSKVTADTNWTYEFKDLPKYDKQLDEYLYTVKEHQVANYTSKVEGYDITNTYDNSTTTEIKGRKIWKDKDNLASLRPKLIHVDLYQNGGNSPIDSVEVMADETGDWHYSFKDLPKYDDQLNEYTYSVKEKQVPMYYESSVDGYDITNTYIDREVVKRHVRKVWDDGDNKHSTRPESIKVKVYQESPSKAIQSKEPFIERDIVPDAKGNWETRFDYLPKFDENNQEYVYTIVEDIVDKYDPSIVSAGNNVVITNHTKDAELTEISGKKIWQDNDDKLGLRPEKITVDLYQTLEYLPTPFAKKEQVPFDTIEITAEDNWEYFFTELPKHDDYGNIYHYEIVERDVAKYDSKVEGYDIINTVNPDKPIDPKEPKEPKTPIGPSKPTVPPDNKPGSYLPKTGEVEGAQWLATLTGLSLMSLLGMIGYRRRKNEID